MTREVGVWIAHRKTVIVILAGKTEQVLKSKRRLGKRVAL